MFRFFETRVDPFPAHEPVQPPTGLVAFIAHYSRPLLPWLIAMSLLTAALSVAEVIFFGYLGSLVDWLGGLPRENFWALHGNRLLFYGVLLILLFPLLALLTSLVLHQSVFGSYPMLIRWLGHRYLLRQSMRFYQDEFAGRVSQKLMQTALAVRESVMKLMEVFVYVSVYFFGAVILIGQSDWRLVIPLVGWLGVYIVLCILFVPRLQQVAAAQADARAQMTGRVVDTYTNIQTIKLFAHTRREQEYARDAMSGFMDTVYWQMRLVTWLTLCLQTANIVLLVAITGVAIYGWQQELVTLGSIAVSVALVMRIRAMSNWIIWEVAGLFENIGTVEDGISTLALPLEVIDAPAATALQVSRGEICFQDISFHYGREGGVIDHLALVIRPGEKVGLVGRSGAGKSTLVNLLLRFYDLESGRILIDGQDIATVTQESLRGHIGMVTQDTSLLHRSIRDNIRYGAPDATDAEIEAVARQSHADEFISDLQDKDGRRGFEAHAGERGVRLSGGQRQRIAIARVLLKNAPILVLDEATSALDSEVEAAIQEQLAALMQGKTVIAIAHRLSTIAALDRLVVMDGGRIVESGTHQELIEHHGIYAGLWQRQSGGFLGVDTEGQAGALDH